MHIFSCVCGQTLFFESSECTACGRTLGYDPASRRTFALDEAGGGLWRASGTGAGALFRRCSTALVHGTCNWLVEAGDENALCRSCRLDEVVPNLDIEANRRRMREIGQAKRRLLHTLLSLGLPFEAPGPRGEPPLAFAFLEDRRTNPAVPDETVHTGHVNGLITLNVAEADPVYRESVREALQEPARTLLGHFRHESGHYYFERLVRGSDWIDEFRARFGDEREDYAAALARHYAGGGGGAWCDRYISAYAQAHPLEDFAECWAHTLQMVDTLETAQQHGVVHDPGLGGDFDQHVEAWVRCTVVLNELNRSVGWPDAYPFVLTPPIIGKLRLVRDVICRAAGPT